MSVNLVILVGRLGKDPELTYTQSGTARCRFSLATSESYTNNSGERQEKTDWHNIILWGKQAESVSKYLSKGSECYLEGKIENRSWDDQKTGQKKYITEVNARRVVFLGGGGGKGRRGNDDEGEPRGKRREADDGGTESTEQPGAGSNAGSDDSDGIPF